MRATATIHLAALRNNFNYIRSLAGPDCKICGMVKADAYGHGLVGVSRELERCGAGYFGVADILEAQTLREAGVKTPILMMGYTAVCDMPKLTQYNLTQTVFSAEYAALLQEHIRGRLTCHLKLDTGMSRLGFVCADDGTPSEEMLRALRCDHLVYEGAYTHFAKSDVPTDPMTAHQYARFFNTTEALRRMGYPLPLRHVANSAAILYDPQMRFEMVRPGILLYGLMPDGSRNDRLQPVMELSGAVELTKTVRAGETISYGGMHYCEKDMRIAVVSLGYADGVSRALSDRGEVLINGRRAPIVGRICMDHFMADVSDFGEIACATPAYIIGGGPNGITADEIARIEGTISYEVLCRMVGSRVVKEFVE